MSQSLYLSPGFQTISEVDFYFVPASSAGLVTVLSVLSKYHTPYVCEPGASKRTTNNQGNYSTAEVGMQAKSGTSFAHFAIANSEISCVFPSINLHKQQKIIGPQVANPPHLRKVRKSNKLFISANLRIFYLRNLFANIGSTLCV